MEIKPAHPSVDVKIPHIKHGQEDNIQNKEGWQFIM
jgi:hypothetical protein